MQLQVQTFARNRYLAYRPATAKAARLVTCSASSNSKCKQQAPIQLLKDLVSKTCQSLASLAVAGSLVLIPPLVSSAAAEPAMVRLPASSDARIFAAQRTMVEAWTIVGEQFVDDTYNSHVWEDELRTHMLAAYNATEPDKAFAEISKLLAKLGDPYTRRISPEDYQSFRMSSDGELQGVGLLIANEPTSDGNLLVLAPIKGGPADRAGILPGDEVMQINGENIGGLSGDQAARMLRGRGGTEVRVKLARRSDQIPGVPGKPEPLPTVEYKTIALKRERVALSPVYYTALQQDGQLVGYVRLTQFSNNAADEMRRAIEDLEAQGASSYILDLRGNPGGLVRASVDVASLWLGEESTVFTVKGRQGPTLAQTTDTGRRALTRDPMVVLVNDMSASASEILSGALKDSHRATIVGDGNTFGKGRIQSVFELQDGSALFVTVAKYQTPNGFDIDRKGIVPDTTCRPPLVVHNQPTNTTFAPGIPVGPVAEELFKQQLLADPCVMAAEKALRNKVPTLPSTTAGGGIASSRPLTAPPLQATAGRVPLMLMRQ